MRFDTNIQVKVRDAYAARHEPEAARALARIYWASMITLFSCAATLSILYGAWEFFRSPVQDANTITVRPQVAFTKAQLDGTLKGFDGRADRFQQKLTEPITAKDPSTP